MTILLMVWPLSWGETFLLPRENCLGAAGAMASPPVSTCLQREAGSDFSTPSIGDSRTELLSHSGCCSQRSNASLEALQALSHALQALSHGMASSPAPANTWPGMCLTAMAP